MRLHRLIGVCVVVGALLSASVALAAKKSTITMSGSTSVYPLAVKLATKYHKLHKKVAFRILQGGSNTGIDDVAHGRVTIGDSSRDPITGPNGDPHGLNFNRIARDAVCVITNPANPLSGLSQQQVQAIFSGQVRSWSDISGSHLTKPIDVITRNSASGTADAFQNIFLGLNLKVFSGAAEKASNGQVQATVAHTPTAIGYVSLDFIDGVHTVPYQGVGCTLRAAKSGSYKGVRTFYLVTRGAPKGAAKSFVNWARSSAAAHRIINTNWIVP